MKLFLICLVSIGLVICFFVSIFAKLVILASIIIGVPAMLLAEELFKGFKDLNEHEKNIQARRENLDVN